MSRLPGFRLVAGCVVLGLAGAVPAGARQAAAPAAGYRESIAGTLVAFEMVRVSAGSAIVDTGAGPRTVDVPAFHIGRTEVTWDLYDVFALGLDQPREGDATARPSNPYGAPDRGWGHTGFPVMSVTRDAADAFCAWLSATTGRAYRLPTEAEWSRAAALASGGGLDAGRLDAIAWWQGNAAGRTHDVSSRQPDALGLFDLFGNVAEWVTTDTDERVTRGGSFRDPADRVGPHARAVQHPSWNESDPQLPKSRWWLSDAPFVGVRLALTAEGEER
ncbi:MAG TPA: SUMF1/EgtB/PvdO family nonheme iron enzyme [Vicinamibacterales bacterium]|nr:SUMF1/EgtB/PvdO family nonheme iron enzyme [Vicinamibacterales bacterium]